MGFVITFVTVGALTLLLALTVVLGGEAAAVSVLTRGRVKRLAAAERRGAAELERLMRHPGRLLATRALVTGVAYAGAGALLTWMMAETYADIPVYLCVVASLVVASIAVFVFGEAMPRALALRSPERVGLALAGFAHGLTVVVSPVARALSIPWTWAGSLISGDRGPEVPWVTFEEYEELATGEEPEREASREELTESVERFSDRIVREVMVPRTDMQCLEDTATAADALALIREAGFSRLPVFHENLDDIRGVLYARDLLLALGEGWDAHLRISHLTRPAYFVPETKPIHELLVEMRRTAHLALVADEYGGTAGLVTIEDLLEEIVGEIFDEYDQPVPMMVDLGEGRYRVDGRLPIDDLNEHFATDIEREADTVAGLFIEEAGHIPEAGETVDVAGLRLIVTEFEGNRIRQLVVGPIDADQDEGGGDGGHHAG